MVVSDDVALHTEDVSDIRQVETYAAAAWQLVIDQRPSVNVSTKIAPAIAPTLADHDVVKGYENFN